MKPVKIEISIPDEDIKQFIVDLTSQILNKVEISQNASYNISKPEYNNYKNSLELFTISDVSKKLKINVSDTYKLIKSGHLKALKLGSLKVTSKELERFISFIEGKDFSDLNNVKYLEFIKD